MKRTFTIGIDYGTNSVRTVVVDVTDGGEIGTAVFDYPSGDQGILLDPRDPHLARQNPADYVAGLEASVKGALAEARGLAATDQNVAAMAKFIEAWDALQLALGGPAPFGASR